jgi:hypothetical protein
MPKGRPQAVFLGDRFGRLTTVEDLGVEPGKGRIWRCRCDCGNEVSVPAKQLKYKQRSCGCITTRTHGRSRDAGSKNLSPTYAIWAQVIQRCTNPKSSAWKWYGARGITVCDRWRYSFSAFLEDMGERPEGLSIDRIDNDGNYEPGNCRWATKSQQNANRRRATAT